MADISKIEEMLKHRNPFLFIDTIEKISSHHITTSYFLSKTHTLLQGHFPGNPIMPGVLLIEGIAQSAGFLILYNVIKEKECKPEELDHESFLVKVNSVKFKKIVVPDSKIEFKVKVAPLMSDFYEAVGQVYGDQKLVAVGAVTLYFKLI